MVAQKNKEISLRLFYEENKHHLHLKTLRNFLLNKILSHYRAEEKGLNWSLVLALNTLKTYCANSNCTPYVLYIPNSNYWRPDARSIEYRRQLQKYTQSLGIGFTDATDILEPFSIDAYALKGPHLSPKGYKAIATEILNIISNESR